MKGIHIISRKPGNVFLTACHSLFTEIFYMVIQINPLSELSYVDDVCSVNCVIMHIYIYTTMELLSHWKFVVFFYRVSLLTAENYSVANCLRELLHRCNKRAGK